MAVAMVLEFTGANTDQYDQVISKMGFTPQGSGGPGGLFHWVTKTDDGLRITDVWATREACDKFTQEHILPITAAVGIPQPSKVTYYDVHNYLTAG